ncbi:MAG: MBL fold metallo-hydrolase [Patescibacteria group bacterium]
MSFVKNNFKYIFVALLLVGAVLVWYAVFSEDREGLEVYFLDVGQGDAIFIQAENGNQVLLDGGKNKEVLRQLSKVMPFYDRSINVVIESHPDSDHISGLVDVLKRYNVGLMMESGVDTSSDVYQEIEKVVKEKNIQKVLARKGMIINLGGGAYLEILFPDREVNGLETNQASIVAKLVYGETSFLLTGDSPKSMEKYLVSVFGEGLDSNVLKVGHHGSKTSTSELLLGYSDSEYAVISVGADNSYDHPSQEVLDLLERFDVKILRTDERGTIKIKSDGESIAIDE